MPPLKLMRAVLVLGTFVFVASTLAEGRASDWPQWRGPNRDGVSAETGLQSSWTAGPPKQAWLYEGVGTGYSNPSVVDGVLYVIGAGDDEFLSALELPQAASGTPKLLWKSSVGAKGDGVGYPGSRCCPTIDGDSIYATTTAGDIACLDRANGNVRWRKNMARDFDGRMMSSWGFSESPLVDGPNVIVTPGGNKAGIVALDKKTGETVWVSSIPDPKGAGYASLVRSEGAGVPQYITLLGRGLVSVAANDGRLLWTYDRIANGTANIPTPIVRGNDVFASTGYGTGSCLLRLTKSGSGVKATEVYWLDAGKLQNTHGGIVLVGDHLYAGTGHNRGNPICVEFKTGKIAWRERRPPGDGSAAVSYADGNLYFRYQDGTVALIEATPEEFRQKGTLKIPDVDQPSWPHPVISNGMLILREQNRIYAYDCRS